jgi:hypothetical protein
LTELQIEGGGVRRLGRVQRARRLRWYLLALAVTVLCGATYLLGIWVGMRTHVTCTTTSPGQIVCATGEIPNVPQPAPRPLLPPQEQGSA